MVEDADAFDIGSHSSPEVRAYKAMFATITSLHTQEYTNIHSKVVFVLNKLKRLKSIPLELQVWTYVQDVSI